MAMAPLQLDGASLTLADVVAVARRGRMVALSDSARAEMLRSYGWVSEVGRGNKPIYGVTTGFGSLARVTIAPKDRAALSLNLIRSHAAGVGPALPVEVVRAMMLLRANALAKGASGCRPLIVDTILALLNGGITPVVPARGSCGSSGDLAPLAHLGLVLAEGDHGQVHVGGQVLPAGQALEAAGIGRLQLEAKDGLAITNGAQLTTALAALACHDAGVLIRGAEIAAAMSIEALCGATRAFHPAVHALRPYAGARATAANLCRLLAGSGWVDSVPGKVQDAYSLRCTPQVLGAVRDTMAHAAAQVRVELNAATDNPLILLDADPSAGGFQTDPENHAYSAGLFHGEPVGMAMDILRIGVAELANLSERRLYRLTTGNLSQRLPAGLVARDKPGLGVLLPQTTAAALVSENKALGWPASLDSIPTCEDQEDHVAMSTTAARRTRRVVENSQRVVAIELMGASLALQLRAAAEPERALGAGTAPALAAVQATLGSLRPNTTPGQRIEALAALLASDTLGQAGPALLVLGEAPA